jgi:hypothetical protein
MEPAKWSKRESPNIVQSPLVRNAVPTSREATEMDSNQSNKK